jgi:hypothetical protein
VEVRRFAKGRRNNAGKEKKGSRGFALFLPVLWVSVHKQLAVSWKFN